MLDVKQLRVLKSVAEHGSFSAAAEALSYTQPAISQQIAALEKATGATLVDRTSRGVFLTDAGRALVDHAQVVLARLAAAEAELDAIAGVRGGRVRLAAFPTAGASVLPPAIARFTQRHPDVELTFIEKEPEDSIQMLRSGRARGGGRVRVPRPHPARMGSPLRRRRAPPPGRGPDVRRAAERPSALPQAARPPRRPLRRDLDPGRRPAQPVRAPAPVGLPGGRASSRASPSGPTTTTSSRGWSPPALACPCCRAWRSRTCARTSWSARSASWPRRAGSPRPRRPGATARPPPRRCSRSWARWRRLRAADRRGGCRRLTA